MRFREPCSPTSLAKKWCGAAAVGALVLVDDFPPVAGLAPLPRPSQGWHPTYASIWIISDAREAPTERSPPHFDIPPQTATTTMFRASRVSASGLELPPSTDRPQSFTTQLGSAVYQFDLRWNDRSNVWTMDISDPVSGNPIVSGLAVVLGADPLKPYALGIGT